MPARPASFLFYNKIYPPSDPQISFEGKTILITGANTGLGYAAALKLVQKGCTDLILAVRSLERGDKAKQQIVKTTNCNENFIKVWQLDQASFESVRAFAKKVTKELPKLDIVILNAAVLPEEFRLTGDGWEEALQVNSLSTTLLALLLLPKLIETADKQAKRKEKDGKPRLCFVSSGGAKYGDADVLKSSTETNALKAVNSKEKYPGGRDHYETTKILAEYSMMSISNLPGVWSGRGKTRSPKVIVNSSYPGACVSEISRERIKDSAIAPWIMSVMLRSAEQGARSIVGAVRSLGEESQGKWWWNDELAERGTIVDGPEGEKMREKMWREMVEVIGDAAPEIKDIPGVL